MEDCCVFELLVSDVGARRRTDGSGDPRRCKGSSSTSPSSQAITDFVTAVQGTDGTAAVQTLTGTPPAASGGPSLTATAGSATSATVIDGGSSLVHLQATAPFTSAFVSVSDGPLNGFYTLSFASTTDVFIVLELGHTIPVNTFQTIFSVKTAAGLVSASASIANTVNTSAASGQVQVSVNWDALSDVDLHVIDPSNNEIYWANKTADGGTLNLDANAACVIDNPVINTENISWPTNAPNGTYTVRVDLWSICNKPSVNYVVTANNGGSTTVKTGSFTPAQADMGGAGSGVTVLTFTHTASSLTTQSAPSAPQPLSPSALQKLAISAAAGGGR